MDQFPSFEAYVEAECGGWTDGGKCGGCMREAPRLTAGKVSHGIGLRDGDCENCLRYQYGYDQAEWGVIRTMLGGAVRAAIRAEVAPSLIREAVDSAIDDENERNTEDAFQAGMKVEG